MKQTADLSELKFVSHGFYNALDSKTLTRPITMNQVHSADVLFLTEEPAEKPSVDALITKTPNLCLTVRTADCAPVLLADSGSQMVAAVHAGWRGAFQGILEITVLKMLQHGANLQTIRAAIGPHIQVQSFEAGSDMQALFPSSEHHFFTEKNGRLMFDFDAYVVHRLRRAGISRIESVGDDTYTDFSYFSYRREPDNPGRQYSSIMIRGSYE